MAWVKNREKKAGGNWICLVKRRASRARYAASEKGLAMHRRYNHSEKGQVRSLLHELGRVRVYY